MLSMLLTTLLLATIAKSDFYLSNTTVCLGAFPVSQCTIGPQLITPGTDYNATFTCDKLWAAQDNSYVRNGTLGPSGSLHTYSSGDVCDKGVLRFVKDDEAYKVQDSTGAELGGCVEDVGFNRSCGEFFGRRFFGSTYKCSGVC